MRGPDTAEAESIFDQSRSKYNNHNHRAAMCPPAPFSTGYVRSISTARLTQLQFYTSIVFEMIPAVPTTAFIENDSSAKLGLGAHPLRGLHLRPINVVISHGP